MLKGWVVIAVALGYIGLLFLVASYGDRVRRLGRDSRARLLIYPLSLAIYCTSWTFFGSVGSASRTGYEFLTIYIGPVLMIGLFAPLITRIVRLAKAQNITSIADFIAARYGKGQAVAALITLFAFLAVGIFVTFWLFGGPSALLAAASEHSWAMSVFERAPKLDTFIATTVLSFFAIILLPRQFHVAVVENNNEGEIRRAAWLFPLYLVLINLFVVPVAIAGLLSFAPGEVDSDMFVLAL